MDAPTDKNERPLRQIRTAASELLREGKPDEALELSLSALKAVLVRNTELELLLKKLRKANAGKSSSEKLDAGQLELLFELLDMESESGEDATPNIEEETQADAALDKEIKEAQAQSEKADENPKKKKRQRNKALNAEGLEVSHTFLPIPAEHSDWEVIGEELRSRLRYSPAHFFIEQIHQPIVRNPEPQEDGSLGDQLVAAPPTVVPNGMPGNDVIAMLLIRKFEEHMPLHRMHRQFLREQGLDLPVSTLADWVAWGGRALQRLVPLLLAELPNAFLVQTDATGMRVLDSEAEHVHRGTFHTYLLRFDGPDRPPDIVLCYTPTGESELGPWTILEGREGYILADASNAFDRLFNGKVASALEVGCHFHARRRFKAEDGDPRSAYVLQLVRRLYRLETLAETQGLHGQERTAFRKRRSKPVLKKLFHYIRKLARDSTPDDPIGKAARYYINHRDALTRFAEDGRLPLDNNDVERVFRGLRIGERNFLFAGSDAAAERMAAIYSVLATAKAHGLNLHEYLCDILDRLSYPMSQVQLVDLLPHQWKQQRVSDGPHLDAECS